MRPGRDTTHPSNTKTKTEWNYTSTPPYTLMVRRHHVYYKVQFVLIVLELFCLLFETYQ
jgi:hypothetical protein